MTAKVTLLVNSNGPAGWSETYYTSSTTIAQAQNDAQIIVDARTPLLAAEYYVDGWRTSIVGMPGVSAVTLVAPNQQGTPSEEDNDLPSSGLSYYMTNGTFKVPRILRGVPDAWAVWSRFVNRMVPAPNVVKLFNSFRNTMLGLAVGWPHAAIRGSGGSSTQPITSLTISPSGQLGIVIPSTAGYGTINGSPIVLSGFRGLAGRLNGTYGPNAYSVQSGPAGLQLRVQASLGQTSNYTSGTAFVRLANNFGNFQTATTFQLVQRIVSHKVGRPFGSTRGRRSGHR